LLFLFSLALWLSGTLALSFIQVLLFKRFPIRRYKLIICGVLQKEIDSLRARIPSDIELVETWLEQGLHREPDRLNALVKQAIAEAEEENEPLDAILLGYGICSHGTIGVSSRKYRIVIPRAHDCITLFLGSKERYLEEFSRAPGTYWFTPGFVGGKMQPGMSERFSGVYQQYEEEYEKYRKQFGTDELAKFVIDSQEQAWIRNYSRGAYVESGLPGGEALRDKAHRFCEARNWNFAEVRGDLGLVLDLISGNWDPGRFLVLEPGQTTVIGGVEEVIAARGGAAREDAFSGEDTERHYLFEEEYRESEAAAELPAGGADLVIGIDAGGTFTDAVAISLRDKRVLAAGKAPTTHHDLGIGIRNALLTLPETLRTAAGRLAISTTLATNAIVEEKGSRTGLLLIGYDEDVASRVTVGSGDLKARVPGQHDIFGLETEPLNEDALIREASGLLARGMEALAVSSYMGTRNPGHEMQALRLLRERFDIPVALGHELTDDIDSVRRAHTVLLNARLLPVIAALIDSLQAVVRELGMPADIRLVTTEGSLMNVSEARERPVRMILSGPAASVEGVRFLTGLSSCVLADLGGTTTDIAMIEGGSARRSGRGATVGRYPTSIHATDIRTLGLGGDSAIGWERGKVSVGPRRAVPACVLAAEHPEIRDELARLRGYSASDYGLVQPGAFFVPVRKPESASGLTGRERDILAILENGPVSQVRLASLLSYPYLSLLGTERLEELGLVRRSGLTPTDLMVLEGSVDRWDSEAAGLALDLFTERSGLPREGFIRRVWTEVHRLAASSIITETFSGNGDRVFPGCHYCEGTFGTDGPLEVSYRLKSPLVGIGAPAHLMLKGLDSHLRAETVFPEWAGVANAVGAGAGAGGMHIDLSIMPDGKGRFLLYAPEGMQVFRKLNDAKAEALRLAKETAREYAQRMGYGRFALDVRIRDRSAPSAFSGDIYIDTGVVAKMRY
jgi:N-methylhydantoinase A/oxoprolinase/acetone carboxylase beta subunit